MLVCVLCVCLCPMIDAIRVNIVRESRALEECEGEDILSNYFLVKAKCVIDLLSQQFY
jgi:hypothetical protein